MSQSTVLDVRTLRGVPPEEVILRVVEWAVCLNSSDLFISTEREVAWIAVRYQGVIRRVCDFTSDEGQRLVGHLKAVAGMPYAKKHLPADGRWTCILPSGKRAELRINTIPTLWGEELAVRILECGAGLSHLSELGYAEQTLESLRNLLNSAHGLLLVTGPTGAGKSTTLYACLHYLNDGHRKINTIEDPIEYEVPGIRQAQVRPEFELDFPVLLRSVLRQAPDVVMIGEIRDAVTADTAVRAANSGHLVLATIHAACAAGCIDTMLCYGVNPRFLANSLLGAVSQRLVRRLCDHCKAPHDISTLPMALNEARPWFEATKTDRIYAPKGCQHCNYDGYVKRMAVSEVLCVVPEVRRMIDQRASVLEVQNKAKELGMVDLHDSCLQALADGRTSAQEIVRLVVASMEEVERGEVQ